MVPTTIFSASTLKRRFKRRKGPESQKGETPGTLELGAALGSATFDLGLYSVPGGQKGTSRLLKKSVCMVI
jgi:hypothetical protein